MIIKPLAADDTRNRGAKSSRPLVTTKTPRWDRQIHAYPHVIENKTRQKGKWIQQIHLPAFRRTIGRAGVATH